MYNILGADQKQYGPVSAEVVRQWIMERRATGQTMIQPEGSTEWKPLVEFPEFRDALAASAAPGAPPGIPRPGVSMAVEGERKGLAITSLVLGILGMVCLGPLAGIPAFITGLIALNRTRQEPQTYGGRGFAIAGLALGACGILMTVVLAGLLLPALAKAKARAQQINCISNLKQIGLGARMYANDYKGMFPRDFQTMSNELTTPKILCCPADLSKTRAVTWESLTPANISYEWLGAGLQEGKVSPTQVVTRCPIHGNVVRADGSAVMGNRRDTRPGK